jgi:hypothetical protein
MRGKKPIADSLPDAPVDEPLPGIIPEVAGKIHPPKDK